MTVLTNLSDIAPASSNIAELARVSREPSISDELRALAHMVEDACPCHMHISFSFAHDLRIAIDVRTLEEVHIVETALPRLGGGVFSNISRSATPHHAFFKRVSATIDR